MTVAIGSAWYPRTDPKPPMPAVASRPARTLRRRVPSPGARNRPGACGFLSRTPPATQTTQPVEETTPMPDLTDHIAEMGVIRPGDTVMIRFDRPVSMADVTEYRQRLEAKVPGVQFVFTDAAQALIVRPDEDGTP